MIYPHELTVDNFAGGGGASDGASIGLGRPIDIAINHDPAAIAMHKMNHPETTHYCESIWDINPITVCMGKTVGFAWYSPDCKHFSKAKGNTPVDKNVRGLAWVAVKWDIDVGVRTFMLENVEEFLTWGPVVDGKACKKRKGETFKAFIKVLTTGLSVTHPAIFEIKAALGDSFSLSTIEKGLGYKVEWRVLKACDYGVPTIRKRLYLVARKDGVPIKWPKATHGEGLLPYKTAADIIDWNHPVKSIFNRKRPLSEKTLMRIAKGMQRYIIDSDKPFIVPGAELSPFITECANGSNQRNMQADEPLRTICAQVKGGHFAVVTSHMMKFRGNNVGHSTDSPLHTVSAGGIHAAEVRTFLIKYYGTGVAKPLTVPLDTVTTKDRFGLVMVRGEAYQIVDIGFRMLQPRELFNAQGFRPSYIIDVDSEGNPLTKISQVNRCGNAVCPPMATALVVANGLGAPNA